ncbi:hypothetical protein GGTG_03496 [Gaeumannomyces tritici R3-111a-1]|uniref:Uncharacterized protein n=1 Tax=Gaeumannomyces tritici (strain R3-111a-1) TaxID=644352 RepID=J3NQD9_GAET3|nr:hypothetical protein GGTG_03496 [Gaeumannomyces tritici R3-111a-1]EJT78395.1 hypothetical protein GGTG_03496 [Gaeumannomyces tritici R3-111a-1]
MASLRRCKFRAVLAALCSLRPPTAPSCKVKLCHISERCLPDIPLPTCDGSECREASVSDPLDHTLSEKVSAGVVQDPDRRKVTLRPGSDLKFVRMSPSKRRSNLGHETQEIPDDTP